MLLEICIDSFASALAAKNGGADRLEICSALSVGGTTPSHSLIQQCVDHLGMPSMIMIRPHDGGFVYSDDDLHVMIGNIESARSIGVQGVVFGALTPGRKVDLESCKRLLDACRDLETTFHRAVDVTLDPLEALASIEQLGFDRVLTSGQQASAIAGADLICQMVQQSSSVKILAGAGITASNVNELIAHTSVQEVHASASVATSESQAQDDVSFGEHRRVTSEKKVREIVANLASL